MEEGLEYSGCAEGYSPAGGNPDLLFGMRVGSNSGLGVEDFEGAKAGEIYPFACHESILDDLKERVQELRGVLLGDVFFIGQFGDDVRTSHLVSFLSMDVSW